MKPIMKKAMLWLALLFTIGSMTSAQQTALPIKVSENGRYFVDQNGNPVFWLGTTQWELFHGFSQEDARTILEESRKNGFTFVQVKLMGGGDGTKPNVYGQKAWIDNDSLMPNEGYFRNVDAVIQMARDNNLVILPSIYHQSYRKYITLDKARRWAKWLAQRYKDAPNIVWTTTPEARQEFVPIIRELAAGLGEGDGGRHLISFKPDPAPYSSSFLHSESWLDFNSMQTWNAVKLIYPMVTHDYNLKPVKPVLMAEGAYEAGFEYKFDVTPLWVRRQAYYSYLAGAHHTYGHNASWRVLPTWKEALNAPGAIQMGVLKKIFLARKEWWLLVPDQSLFASGGRVSDSPLPRVFATEEEWSAYVRGLGPFDSGGQPSGNELLHLAARHRDGKWAMFYLADKASFTVNMSKLNTAKVNVSWVNPITGDRTPMGQESNTGVKSFSTPEGWEDALLILEAVDSPVPPTR
jgi:Protein of unknown function (DUF4038)/Putative collagen-binding domain of a collagenase